MTSRMSKKHIDIFQKILGTKGCIALYWENKQERTDLYCERREQICCSECSHPCLKKCISADKENQKNTCCFPLSFLDGAWKSYISITKKENYSYLDWREYVQEHE